jgi:hypothetical protein
MIKINKKWFASLAKKIDKDFGKQCWGRANHKMKDYSPTCPCCQAWLAYHTLRDLYEIDYVFKKYEKRNKGNVKAVKSDRRG